jgi:drug/metabolite transporter (DMT)-like permease
MTYLTLVSFVWAFSFVLIKGNLSGLDPNFVSFARMTLSFLIFLPFLRLKGIALRNKLNLMLIGGMQFGLMYIAYITAYQYLPAHMIALLTTTTPIFVTLFNDSYTKKFHKLFLLTALLAVIGGGIIKYPDQPLSANLKGVVLIQLSNIAFAYGQLHYKKLADKHPAWKDRQIFGLLYLAAVVVTGIFSLFSTNYPALRLTATQLITLIYLGCVASGICFFLWNKGAKSVNEGMLAIMNNLKIPLAIIASLILLKESTNVIRLILGTGLMFGAVYLNETIDRNEKNLSVVK